MDAELEPKPESEIEIGPNICPRCGALALWPDVTRASGTGSGVVIRPDGTRSFARNPGYIMACPGCLIDLYYFTTWEDALAREFYWEMRELGPQRGSYHAEERWRLAVLAPLLEMHAERQRVVADLGLVFADFSMGSSRREELKQWQFFEVVNDAAGRYPGVFVHIGPFAMTWLFFDSANRLQGYYVRPT